jgi:hypothetical protein
MNLTDVRIVKAEPVGPIVDIGAAAAKALPPGMRYRYARAMRYTLDDGRTAPGTAKGLTKPKLAGRITSYVEYAQNGALFASFRDGAYTGTVLKMSLMMR